MKSKNPFITSIYMPELKVVLNNRRNVLLTLIIALLGFSYKIVAKSISDLSGSSQLFIDDSVVDKKENIKRTYHKFKKSPINPFIIADNPWEKAGIGLFGTVLPNPNERGYRMWYYGYGAHDLLYAQSIDGIFWLKPFIGLINFEGSTNNNILYQNCLLPSIIHTPWEAQINSEYKTIYYNLNNYSYEALVSPDGIHWKPYEENPLAPFPTSVGNFTWDEHTKRYFASVRIMAKVGGNEGIVITKAFVGSSNKLFINADASLGWIKVEVLDSSGKVIPEYDHCNAISIRKNGIKLPVMWKNKKELPLLTQSQLLYGSS